MDRNAKVKIPPYVMLMLVAILMSFAIAGVYNLTKDTIEAAALQAQEAARRAVMPEAASMTEVALEEGAPLDYCFEALDEDGGLLGYVGQITVVGFGGEIEVTVGMDTAAAVTAIEVGGKDFSETSGLGARTREPAFKDQFRGKSGMLVLKQSIDSVTGASISSGAVVSGVNRAVDYMKTLLPAERIFADVEELPLTEEQIAQVLPGAENVRWMGGGAGIDGWWQAEGGYVVRATGFGEGPIAVTVGFDSDRTVTGMIIGDENFMETEGRGDGILADWYRAQFVGKSGVQTYGDGIDAISGATVTSNAALAAINACMGFDPAAPEEVPELPEAPAAAGQEPDAVTEATVPGEASAGPAAAAEGAAGPVPDAVTEATAPEETTPAARTGGYTIEPVPPAVPDAVTEPSIPAEDPPAAPMPDAVTEATVPAEDPPAVRTGGYTIEPAHPAAPDAVTEASVTE